MIICQEFFQCCAIKRILIISKAEDIWIIGKNYFVWIRKWPENNSTRKSRVKNVFHTISLWVSRIFSFYTFNSSITSNYGDKGISEFFCLS